MNNIFKTKPIDLLIRESAGDSNRTLKRSLSTISIIAFGIGAIIGAGIFSLTGIAAAEHAGPGVMLSFVLAGIACVFAGLCYSEFASMIPVAGSAYTYSYATMGEFFAWFIGWDLILEYVLTASTVAVSWSQYLTKFLEKFNIVIPEALCKGPFEQGIVNLPAIFIILLVSFVLIRGIQQSSWVNTILVILKLSVIFIFIILGWKFVNPELHKPLIPENTGQFGSFGWSGVAMGAAVLFFAFVGFDAISTTAQEAKNPQKSLPIAILGSLLICTVLYVLFSYVMTGLVDYKVFEGDASPASTAFSRTGYKNIELFIVLTILFGYTSVILVMLLAQSRIFYSMSRDGLLPKFFGDIHPKFKTPWKTNLFFMLFASIMAGFVPIKDLGHMVSMGTLLAFSIVCIGIIVLRKKFPDMPRKFRTPLVPIIPILGTLCCVGLMCTLPKEAWIRLIVWAVIGLIIYFTYGKNRSKIKEL